MEVRGTSYGRWLAGGLVVLAGACSNDGGGADTDIATLTDGASTSTGTGGDTDTETDTEVEPPPVTTELTIDVTYRSEMMMTGTGSLHVWVLQPKMGQDLSCGDLVSDEADPYDLGFVRLADHVSTTPLEPVVIPEVEVGEGLVYVEGVSVVGTADLAGCAPASLVAPSLSVQISLGLARTFDCADAATENGSPCDDGAFCTVGETCQGGSCQGGIARDCSVLADQCNAANCSEADGCVVEPVPNDTMCDDGMACTLGDSCQDGACLGMLRDCEPEAPVCQQSAGCLEPTGECLFIEADENLPCDDGLYCTVNNLCIGGECVGNDRVCPGDDCNLPVCDEVGGSCTTTFAGTTIVCDDTANECTDDAGLCDGAGACVAAAANEDMPCDDGVPGTCIAGVCE